MKRKFGKILIINWFRLLLLRKIENFLLEKMFIGLKQADH